jgi:TonB family protein
MMIVGLGLVSLYDHPPDRPLYTELIQPDLHKIIYYDFRKRLPDVTPVKKTGRSKDARGEEISKQTIVATSPKAKSIEQFIWQPAPKIEVPQDQRADNMIARLKTALPSLPAPKEPPPEPVNDAVRIRQQPKTFTPPPPSPREPKLPLQTPTIDLAAPSINAAAPVPLQGRQSLSTLATLSAPPLDAPPASVVNAGNASVDIAIANLHPPDKVSIALPNGERPAQFSKAPVEGPAASGDVNRSSALTVPNLTVREDRSKSVKAAEDLPNPSLNPNPKTVLYTERVRSVPASTLSVPLRPASRTIPRDVDARFQGRNVYTMVVPIENLPAYGGDWIVWFAERTPNPGDTPVVRAPVPFRKTEIFAEAAPGAKTPRRVRIITMIAKDGRIGGVSVIGSSDPAFEEAVVRDVASWEFKPATRNGVPVDVEVVIEIPFNLPPALAQRSQP